ncbi:MAG: glycosyltransferase, partial [Bacteroidetes bacterium]|nr:glycosyltransferase [Bacteroidota bacterium]
MKERKWPKVSIVMATLNAERVLEDCLISIASQNYPKDKIEIILGDGGSTDATKEIAKKYNALIVHNPLKTAESGKMTALRRSTGEYIALIDSDNILPSSDWLQRMIKPLLHHTEAVGSEPIEYSWRKQDGFITRYCALLGMNDPLVHFLGNYDRTNLLSGTWTEVRRSEVQHDGYLLVHFNSFPLPTIGANGTVLRASFLKSYTKGNYLFDIDILSSYLH